MWCDYVWHFGGQNFGQKGAHHVMDASCRPNNHNQGNSLLKISKEIPKTKERKDEGSLIKSWFLGRGWGQQLFNFQSPAAHWIARTSSLNCLSCRDPYQTPHSLNCLPPFHWKPLFSLKNASSHPLPKNRLGSKMLFKQAKNGCFEFYFGG